MNTTIKHTPGPWKIEGDFIVGQRYVAALYDWHISDDPNSRYASVNAELREEREANARLIAAAPAMREALLALVQLHNQQEIGAPTSINDWDAAIRAARVALGMESEL
jgi:hypothetical protein